MDDVDKLKKAYRSLTFAARAIGETEPLVVSAPHTIRFDVVEAGDLIAKARVALSRHIGRVKAGNLDEAEEEEDTV